jgi:hypothetical protein
VSRQSSTTYLTADELKQIAAIWLENEGPPGLAAAGNIPSARRLLNMQRPEKELLVSQAL